MDRSPTWGVFLFVVDWGEGGEGKSLGFTV